MTSTSLTPLSSFSRLLPLGLGAAFALSLARRHFSPSLSNLSSTSFDEKEDLSSHLSSFGAVISPSPNVFPLLHSLRHSPLSSLQIFMDFDRTLTSRYFIEPKKEYLRHLPTTSSSSLPTPPSTLASHGVIEHYPEMPSAYRDFASALHEKYFPIELDLTLNEKEREAAMVNWWTEAHEAFVKFKLNKKFIKSSVQLAIKEGKLSLREGGEDLLRHCHKMKIPIVIFSAGLYDIIDEFLTQMGLRFDNIYIVSNQMKFDETTGDIIGFQSKDVIHSMNKNYFRVQNSASYKAFYDQHGIQSRPNVLLMGDSLEDVKMVNGLTGMKYKLNIGFCNEIDGNTKDKKLKEYQKVFDVVITEDGNMGFVRDIVEEMGRQS